MEGYIVSARKYRPESFSTVVGQEPITTTLRNAIKTNHLGHAYLFCGPRGVGKTTCARIFAKTINCSNLTSDAEPCNRCESCRSFIDNRAYNIHELDAASNNSVDDIRNLIEQVRIPPQIGKFSIYIIDEVHMLSAQAFNTFLKTLEEPPAHAIYILATTEKHKIIPTILSRCQIFDFNRIKVDDIVKYLKYVSEKEGIEYESDALNIIAQKADGAMRDALSIFDQLISFSGTKVTYKDVIQNLNVLDYDYYFKITDSFLNQNAAESLVIFNEILENGFDAHNFIVGLSTHLRDLLVCKDRSTLQLLEVGEGIKERYKLQSQQCPQEWLYKALDICSQTDIYFKSSRNQRLHIELALIRLSGIDEIKKNQLTSDDSSSNASEGDDVLPEDEKNRLPDKDSEKNVELEVTQDVKEKITKDQKSSKPVAPQTAELKTKKTGFPSSTYSIRDALMGNENNQVHPKQATDSDQEDVITQSFDKEDLIKSWIGFAEKIKKIKPRMYGTLKNQMPKLNQDFTVEIILSNKAQLDDFKKEIKQELEEYLRNSLKNNQVILSARIQKETKKEKPLYTAEEKYEHMNKKNPSLGKLKQTFDLDFE